MYNPVLTNQLWTSVSSNNIDEKKWTPYCTLTDILENLNWIIAKNHAPKGTSSLVSIPEGMESLAFYFS